jgi:hypothetical protein
MAPGPELAAMLATVDRAVVAAEDLHDLLAARFRLLAHVQGQLLDDVWETARSLGQGACRNTLQRIGFSTRWTTPNGRSYDIGPDKDIILTTDD